MKKSQIRIGVIMQSPDIGGAETYLISLIKEWQEKNVVVKISTNKGKFQEKSERELDAKVYTLPIILDIIGNLKGLIKTIILLPFAIYFYFNLLLKLKKESDFILLTGFTEKILVTFISFILKIPVIWIEYGPLREVLKRNFYIPKFFYIIASRIPKTIVVPTKNTYKSLIKDAYVKKGSIEIIPCGVKIKNNMFLKNKNKKNIVIGSVSRLTREKGQQHLIKAFEAVNKKIPNSKLYIVGDGPDKGYFEEMVEQLNLKKHVEITGFVKDVKDYYKEFDIFAFTTVWPLEGFGLVLAEAMSMRIPIVASDSPPVDEIVENNKNGIIVSVKDLNSFSKAIIKLALDKKMREEMGNNGFKKAERSYNIEQISEKFLKIFNENL